mmetsp:Transcript_5168/g.18923  ORF Transcript_5168/g.18923 Transcript_5168/m.18923 type:complete len:82 (-) Transcript_5168:580-825(-)
MLAAGQVAGLSAVGRNVQTKYEDWVDEHLGGEYEQVDLDAEQGFTRQLGKAHASMITAVHALSAPAMTQPPTEQRESHASS